jgi:2-polyprenyl-3-methyl-5-hydroxy-6-metoxy-1,4-benzoquinol methylase
VLLAREGFSSQSTVNESVVVSLHRSPPTAAKVILPVWGDKYVRQFLETSLPTLLAPGNLPMLASALDCEFIILTSEDDKDQISEHASFSRLSGVCRTELRLIDHLITGSNHSTTITLAYTECVRSVGDAMIDTCFFFLVSDYVVANGSLNNAFERMRHGASAVVVGNLQVDEEEASPWLRHKLRLPDQSLVLPPRELMRWALKHLHPATLANIVNIPLSHNSHTNRLFWRVDGDTVLGRFYLMHMLCVRPELTDFEIGASCDYSFIPEMCPSGNVEAITNSDEYLVIEMQPRGHESNFLRPGPLSPKALAWSLTEWTTATHRANAHTSVIFHADDIPATVGAIMVEADAFIENVEHAIRRKPQPHRGHPYWRGAMVEFQDARGDKLNREEQRFALDSTMASDGLIGSILWRAKAAMMGTPPRVFPWHPAWLDYRLVLQEIEPFLKDPDKQILMLSNAPTAFSVAFADGGKQVRRLRCGPLLRRTPEKYRTLADRFDICLLELAESELDEGGELVDRIAPLMKAGGTVVIVVANHRPVSKARGFGSAMRYHATSFVRSGASPTSIQYVPANPVRWGAFRGLSGLRGIASRWPFIGLPVLAVCAGFLIVLSGLGNLVRLWRTRQTPPRGICSSVLMRLRVDRHKSKTDQSFPDGSAERPASTLDPSETSNRGVEAGEVIAPSAAADAATREPQYSRCVELKEERGLTSLGLMTNQVWHDDPRRLVILLSRYKFVAKMLSGRRNVGEVGCGDAFGTRIVQQEVDKVTAYDFDPVFIEDIRSRLDDRWPLKAVVHDIVADPLPEKHDGLYSLDVLEHIENVDERKYIANLRESLASEGILIIGTPSIESQLHASPLSKAGHVNCKSGKELKALLEEYFTSVFIFSMNDEVVHTGFYPMAHYLFAMCTGPR